MLGKCFGFRFFVVEGKQNGLHRMNVKIASITDISTGDGNMYTLLSIESGNDVHNISDSIMF